MKNSSVLLAVLLFLATGKTLACADFSVPVLSPANATDSNIQNLNDTQLLIAVYNNSMYEIKASKLARRMAGDMKVKKMARAIQTGQEAMNKDFVALLNMKGVAIPDKAPDDLKARFEYLNEWMGKDFNLRYAAASIESQKESISLYNRMFLVAKDADIRQFAKTAISESETQENNAASLLKYINRPITSTW